MARFRRSCLPFLAGLVLLLALAGAADAEIRYGSPFPTGDVGYARPPIGMLILATQGDEIAAGWVEVDGVRGPLWRQGKLVVHYPASPLAPGPHTVRLHVDLAGFRWLPIDRTWRFNVLPGALTELPDPTPEQRLAREEVNRWRREADLRPLRPDPSLDAAAQGHARYRLARPVHDLSAHNETPGEPGFSGTGPGERARFYGYPLWSVAEDIHFLRDQRRAVREWVDSVYHRFPILSPEGEHLGYGFATDGQEAVDVLLVGSTGPLLPGENPGEPLALQEAGPVVVYPAPGQRDVPLRWDGREIPDPYRLFPGARPAGYPITVQFETGRVEATTVEAASLRDATGRPVPVHVLSSGDDEHIRPHIALLPVEDLLPGHRYTVEVRGQARLSDGRTVPFARTWWFTTAGAGDHVLLQADVRIVLDGAPLLSDVPPALKNGRKMLPLRALAEALGARVEWDPDRYDVAITLGTRRIHLKVANDRAVVDDREVLLDAAPMIAQDRTLVPVRFVAESFGLRVEWDAATRTVRLFRG